MIALLIVGNTQAQQTFFQGRLENVSAVYTLQVSGVFNTPDGAGATAPIGPGGSYTVTLRCRTGSEFFVCNDVYSVERSVFRTGRSRNSSLES